MTLATRKLGNDMVTELGFGAMGMSAFYGATPSDEERFELLDAAFASGCTFWDTADAYGDSEEVLGKWFKRTGKRNEIFIATKAGFVKDGANNTSQYLRSQLENSLKLMGTDHIDLFYVHRVDKNVPIEATIRVMAEFVKEGKIRYIGLSEVSADTLRRAYAVHPIAAVQAEYSPFSLEVEQNGLLDACKQLGVTLVAYSPLGRGMLTGSLKSNADIEEGDFRKNAPKFSEENFPRLLKVVESLTEIGKAHNATSGQVTLAWLLAQSQQVIPIPGTKKIKYLKENIASTTVKLSNAEVAYIRELVEKANVSEIERYPEGFNKDLYVDTIRESKN